MIEDNNYLEQFIRTSNGVIYKYNDVKYGLILIKMFDDYCEYKKIKKYYKNYQNIDCLYKIFLFDDRGFIKMEFVRGGLLKDKYESVYERIIIMLNFFEEWVQKLPIISYNYNDSYLYLLENQFNRIKTNCDNEKLLDVLYLYKKCIENVSNIDYNCLIHGDLNFGNILVQDDGRIRVIDLSPIIGCIELELVRYIEDELFSNIEKFDNIIKFIIEENHNNIFNKDKLLKLLSVDCFYRTFDSYFLGDNNEIIDKGIVLSKKIFNWRYKNGFCFISKGN